MGITVKRVLLALATYATREELKQASADLEDIRQALEAAMCLADRVDGARVTPVKLLVNRDLPETTAR